MFLCLCATALLSSCAQYYESERQWADMLVSPQAEAAFGAYFASQNEGTRFILINDAESDAYLTRLGEGIRANSAPCPQRFTYHFVADPAPNAFAAPGGYVYVTSGLIESMDEESELAAIMGHEVNHVVNRHGVRALLRSQWIAGAAKLAARASGGSSEDEQAVGEITGAAISMHFSRDMEREADDTGVSASFRAGFHPAGAVSIFQKFRAMEAASGLSAQERTFSSHPDSLERESAVRAKFMAVPLGEGLKRDSDEFHVIRKRVIALAAKMPKPSAAPEGSSAWCGLLPTVRMPAGGLAAFGIYGVEQYAPVEYRPAEPPKYNWDGANGHDDDEDDEDDDDEGMDEDDEEDW